MTATQLGLSPSHHSTEPVGRIDTADHSWRDEGGGSEVAERCLTFLSNIEITTQPLGRNDAQLLDGLAIVEGRLLVDTNTPVWPGDLLHEAGHIAVAAPEHRANLGPIEADGGDEMAAIAWSYAASLQCDLSLEHLFHNGGYRGDSAILREAFANGSYLGAPMLGFFGMCDPHGHEQDCPFPAMTRWLR
ncbi:MAG: hypothetical protein AAGK01_04460 [Pseudomonadota bacterium]